MKSKKRAHGFIEIGNFLREKRVAAGKSQGDVRRELGYSTPQFVSNWERGIAHPPHADMRKIAALYNCDPNEFCDQYIDLLMKCFENAVRNELSPKKPTKKREFRLKSAVA